MPTAKKAAVIEELMEKLARANAAALIDYRGLTVAEISELRRQLRQREVELEVTKNTLLREAAHRNNMMELDELFVGPTAVAFIYGDEPTGTKTLNDFFRTARVGEIKSGIPRAAAGSRPSSSPGWQSCPAARCCWHRSPASCSRPWPSSPRCSTRQPSSSPTRWPHW